MPRKFEISVIKPGFTHIPYKISEPVRCLLQLDFTLFGESYVNIIAIIQYLTNIEYINNKQIQSNLS